MIETLASLAMAGGISLPAPEVRESIENPRVPLDRIFVTEGTYTGKSVNETNALRLAAVWRCVNIIAGSIAKVPLITYRRTGPNSKEQATDHYLYNLLRYQANPHMTAFRFRRLMQAWLLLWGNAYAEIEISGRGQVLALWPWRPDRVKISPDGTLYTYQMESGDVTVVPDHAMLHIRGLETDGFMGLSPVKQARQSLGLAMAAEEYGARFFGNNARPGAILEHPNKLSDVAANRLRSSWEDMHKGLSGAHRIGILEEGMKLHEVGIPPEDAQFLQTRQFQAIDIARLYGVPPHKIAELSRATFGNIEHQSIEFVQDCLGDWTANWEQELLHSLLSAREQQTIFAKFDTEVLLQGDMRSRYESYAIARQNGFLNANEIRDEIGRNPIPGGDEYIVQLNMQPLNLVRENAENDAQETQQNGGSSDETNQ